MISQKVIGGQGMQATKLKAGIGVNPGHGSLKIVLIQDGHERQEVLLPALVSRAERQLRGAIVTIPTVNIGDQKFWVGEDALVGNPLTALNQARINDDSYIPALVKSGLRHLTPNGQSVEATVAQAFCVTGLPATWSTDRDLANTLVERLRQVGLRPRRVIAEPVGLGYACVLNDDGEIVGDERILSGKVAVIDIGHHTVDGCVLNKLAPVPKSLLTYNLGTAHALLEVAQQLSARYELELNLYQADQAVRRGVLTLGGADEPLPQGHDAPITEMARSVADRLKAAWGNGLQFDAILIGGGGENLRPVVDTLCETFPRNARPTTFGQMGVALGYARLARHLARASQG